MENKMENKIDKEIVTTNISLPKDLMKKIDELAEKDLRSRSSFIAKALSDLINKQSENPEAGNGKI